MKLVFVRPSKASLRLPAHFFQAPPFNPKWGRSLRERLRLYHALAFCVLSDSTLCPRRGLLRTTVGALRAFQTLALDSLIHPDPHPRPS
jgi:hypothetical protein